MFNAIKMWFLKIFDKNNNGKVEVAEVVAVAKEKAQEVVSTADDIGTVAAVVVDVKKKRKARKSKKTS